MTININYFESDLLKRIEKATKENILRRFKEESRGQCFLQLAPMPQRTSKSLMPRLPRLKNGVYLTLVINRILYEKYHRYLDKHVVLFAKYPNNHRKSKKYLRAIKKIKAKIRKNTIKFGIYE